MTGNNGLHLDGAAAQQSTQSISQIVTEMKSILTRIENSSADGIATWSGQASRSFGTTQGDWSGTATKMQAALNEIEAKLTSGFRGYHGHDADIANSVAKSTGGGLTLT